MSAFAYALTGILVREVAPMWGDKAQVAARFSLVLLLLGAFRIMSKSHTTVPKAKLPLAVGLGLGFAAIVLLLTAAIGKTTIANALFVFYASSMASSFMAGTALLKEVVTSNKLLALAFAMSGIGLYSGAIEQGNLGIVFALLAGLFSGGVNVASKLLIGVDRNAVLVVQYTVATLCALILTFASGDEIIRVASMRGVLGIVLFAAIIITGSKLMLYGFQNFDVNMGSVIMASELIFAATMGYIFFGEIPAPHELAGGALALTGSIVGSGLFNRPRLAISFKGR